MPGHPVRSLFPDSPNLAPASALDTAVARVTAAPPSAAQVSEDTKKLVSLGYLSPQDAAAPPARRSRGSTPGLTEGAWNNLWALRAGARGDLAAAERDFRRALELRPGYHSPLFNLAVLYRRQGQGWRRLATFSPRALAAGHADPVGTILSWAVEYRASKQSGPGRPIFLRHASGAYPDNGAIARALGNVLFQRHDCTAAEATLAPFSDAAREPETLNGLALYETCLGNRDRAAALFRRSLAMKADSPASSRRCAFSGAEQYTILLPVIFRQRTVRPRPGCRDLAPALAGDRRHAF